MQCKKESIMWCKIFVGGGIFGVFLTDKAFMNRWKKGTENDQANTDANEGISQVKGRPMNFVMPVNIEEVDDESAHESVDKVPDGAAENHPQ